MPAPECGRVLNNKVSPELKQVESLFIVLLGIHILFVLLSHIPPSSGPAWHPQRPTSTRCTGGRGSSSKTFLITLSDFSSPPPPSYSQGHRTCSNLCGTTNWRELLKLGPTSVIVSSKKTRSSLDTTNSGNQRFKKHKSANVKRYAHNVLVLSPSSP